MELIEEAGLAPDAAILDAGGGASSLAGHLLAAGHTDVTVTDISEAALERAKRELGEAAGQIEWVQADLRDHDFGRRFDLWHDRAVLHFMVDPADRAAYLNRLQHSLRPSGHLVAGIRLSGCSLQPNTRIYTTQPNGPPDPRTATPEKRG